MLTPQQIQEISFERAVFGGYDMTSVDDILEPLTEDYIALYKENSVLKSKMKILVEKLEEYRHQETSMQNAILAAQKTSEQMVADAERKCAKLLREAEETAQMKAKNAGIQAEEETARLELAQRSTAQFIDSMEKRLRRQLELMDELRAKELPTVSAAEPDESEARPYGRPAPVKETPKNTFDLDEQPKAPAAQESADDLIKEISQSIFNGLSTEAEAEPFVQDDAFHGQLSPAKKKIFDDLHFGRTADPTKKGEG